MLESILYFLLEYKKSTSSDFFSYNFFVRDLTVFPNALPKRASSVKGSFFKSAGSSFTYVLRKKQSIFSLRNVAVLIDQVRGLQLLGCNVIN